jgi:hypothetical protein
MKISRFNYIVFLGIALSALISLQGCGSGSRLETAPDGSTITFNPDGHSQTGISAPTCATFALTIRYPDGTPFPKGVVQIFGPFAQPRASAHYQFYSSANCPAGAEINSGFQGQTDVKGEYYFSALIYDVVSVTTSTGTITVPNTFTDNIEAHSGTAFKAAVIEVK